MTMFKKIVKNRLKKKIEKRKTSVKFIFAIISISILIKTINNILKLNEK